MTTSELLQEAKLRPKKTKEESRKKAKLCTMDSASLKQIPDFCGERKHFPVWLTKAAAVCALNGVSSALKPRFKDMLPANGTIPLDKMKPDEFQVILNKNAHLVAMNLLTVMLCDTDAMIKAYQFHEDERLARWVGMETDREALYGV